VSLKCHRSGCNNDVPDDPLALGYPSGVLVTMDGDFCCSEECAQKFREQRDKEMHFICTASDRMFQSWMLGHFEID